MADIGARRSARLALAVCGFALITAAASLLGVLPAGLWIAAALHPASNDPAQLVFHFSTLPRLVTAALCGAALAASGAIFQHVLGNGLASPLTLGVSSGAQLALVAATVFAPATLGAWPDPVSLAGGVASMGLVGLVASRQGFSSLAMIVSGLSVGLFCGTLGALLKVFNRDALSAIFLWGAGSLAQEDWSVVERLVPRLLFLASAVALLLRPLRLLGLSGESARGLGLSLAFFRTATLGVAVCLASTVTAAVGMIGFIEIAAPLIARLAGARTFGRQLAVAALLGAGLLVIVDGAVQVANDRFGAFLPTGAATAFLGAPIVLWFLPRMRANPSAVSGTLQNPLARVRAPGRVLIGLAGLALAALGLALAIGRTDTGWSLLYPGTWHALAPWRLPRVGDAFAGGAMAAAAGTLLQRTTGNALAGPEVLGLGAAVTAGLALALAITTTPSMLFLQGMGTAAAMVLLAFLLWGGMRSRFSPHQLLLTGVALSAALDAIVTLFLAVNDGRANVLLGWISGSTAGADGVSALLFLGSACLFIPLALLFARVLDVLSLGESFARALGVPLAATWLGLMGLSSVLTAAAVLAIGPLTFVGLIGPHLARRLGLRGSLSQVPGAALLGGLIMVLADWLGRIAIAPFELPAGLMAALIGAPYLIAQLCRRPRAG